MQNADWAFAAGALDPKDGDGLRLRQEGRNPERLVVFVRLRTTDAQHARELLEAGLGELPAKERVDFVAALEPDLGADDARILELLLKDRSRDVRFIALLALSDKDTKYPENLPVRGSSTAEAGCSSSAHTATHPPVRRL